MGRKETDYIILFDMICKEKIASSQELKLQYREKYNKSSLNVAVSYLYNALLDVLLALRKDQDSHYILFNKIMKARVLFEKSLFTDALELLDSVKEEAIHYENQIALLYASRMELEFLLSLNMPDISESELVKKHFQISEALKKNRIIYEHSSLFELLMHRIIYKGNVRSQEEKKRMNDLVFAEMSLSSSSKNSFEAKKLHQMFQSNYLMSIGDQKSAFQSFRELDSLFENNPQFWANPPFYYVSVLEGILDNLRSMRDYDKMPYFIERLKKIEDTSTRFQNHVTTLVFLYELFPLLDTGDFASAKKHLDRYHDFRLSKKELIDFFWRAEISLYTALVYIGLNDYKKARTTLANEMIFDNKIHTFPIYRIMRMVNLIIYYELKDTEYVHTESRSIKREILKAGKVSRLESLMFNFLNNNKRQFISSEKKRRLWLKLKTQLADIRNDVYEKQLLKYFDFTAWIESKVCKISLSESLRKNLSVNNTLDD